jgi:hypothetical protein
VGGGCALDIKSFLSTVYWHQATRQVPNASGCNKNHYGQGRTNHKCISGFMYKRPQVVKGYRREIPGPIGRKVT